MNYYIQEAPSKYIHEYLGKLVIDEYPSSIVSSLCKSLGVYGEHVLACAQVFSDKACHIIMPWVGPGGVGQVTYDFLLKYHEIPHCNGWLH